ncbi:MAG TPA: peptidylprolyl isomerase [Bacteroidales bacterium]|nr:peptidylprolyl isomerase [Bacteroidales bacterium]
MKKQSFRILFLLNIFFLSSAVVGRNPQIELQTEFGTIRIVLFADKAPKTVANFLRYIEENRLEEATFYRVVRDDNQQNNAIKIDVIQGGLYEDNHPKMLAAIEHEQTLKSGIKHLDGTISMARNEPGTATSEFFICIGDQPSLDFGGKRNGDGAGFAAFGKVIRGMDAVRKIHEAHADGQYLNPRIKIKFLRKN